MVEAWRHPITPKQWMREIQADLRLHFHKPWWHSVDHQILCEVGGVPLVHFILGSYAKNWLPTQADTALVAQVAKKVKNPPCEDFLVFPPMLTVGTVVDGCHHFTLGDVAHNLRASAVDMELISSFFIRNGMLRKEFDLTAAH